MSRGKFVHSVANYFQKQSYYLNIIDAIGKILSWYSIYIVPAVYSIFDRPPLYLSYYSRSLEKFSGKI